MKIKDPEAYREWLHNNLEMGPWRFALRKGILGWGIPMFFVFIAASFFIPGSRHITTPSLLAWTAFACAFPGFFVGLAFWKIYVTGPAKRHLASSNDQT